MATYNNNNKKTLTQEEMLEPAMSNRQSTSQTAQQARLYGDGVVSLNLHRCLIIVKHSSAFIRLQWTITAR